jgi:hypothetical protein
MRERALRYCDKGIQVGGLLTLLANLMSGETRTRFAAKTCDSVKRVALHFGLK